MLELAGREGYGVAIGILHRQTLEAMAPIGDEGERYGFICKDVCGFAGRGRAVGVGGYGYGVHRLKFGRYRYIASRHGESIVAPAV